MDSEFIQVTDSQGVELEIGDKVLVTLGEGFSQRIVAALKLSSYPKHSKVLIYPENNPPIKDGLMPVK